MPGTISEYNISNTSLREYINVDIMRSLRLQLLNGESPDICKSCRYEDKFDKVSGRQRQLLKSGIQVDNFEKTLCSSPHWTNFEYSLTNQGFTENNPVDLQIDLGNTCNSGCIMCCPTYSSKLALEFKNLHKISPDIFPVYPEIKNWTDNLTLIEKFIDELKHIPTRYIHFLGGETLYLKSFYNICNELISNGSAKTISMGTTTNCTVHTPELEKIIKGFKNVHLGLSVEALNPVNDYIRWPSKINDIKNNLKKFIKLRETTGLHLSLRITPTIFSIYHIDTLFEFMLENNIIAESCNILQDPSYLRIELLPKNLIKDILAKIEKIISKYNITNFKTKTINRRNDNNKKYVIQEIIFEYKRLLENMQYPADRDQELIKLVRALKTFEQSRNNSILNYLPEYEEFLRSYGY